VTKGESDTIKSPNMDSAMNFLERFVGRGCWHRFSWPRNNDNGGHYQICLTCGAAYQYDWKVMRRTGPLLVAGETTNKRSKRQSKIMIADDDPGLRRALDIRLRANHYKTLSAGDGDSALALAQSERPDLILLDLGLPGATGTAVLEHMRASPALAPIPVIVLTAWDSRDFEQLTLELGAAAYLQKPVDNKELLDLIRVSLLPAAKKSRS
jgi:CheY-like chemotaxis protein